MYLTASQSERLTTTAATARCKASSNPSSSCSKRDAQSFLVALRAIEFSSSGGSPSEGTLREALQGNLPFRGVVRGLSKISAGLCGGPQDFPRFSRGQ